MIYDTLQMARRLEGPFSREQATALTEALAKSAQDTIATKEDVGNLRSDLKEEIAKLRAAMIETKTELKGDISKLRAEMIELKTELKGDIADLKAEMIELRVELKGDISGLKGEMAGLKGEIAGLKGELIRWIVGAIVLNLFGTAGLVITLTRILAH